MHKHRKGYIFRKIWDPEKRDKKSEERKRKRKKFDSSFFSFVFLWSPLKSPTGERTIRGSILKKDFDIRDELGKELKPKTRLWKQRKKKFH
jgi:hypothetical protein